MPPGPADNDGGRGEDYAVQIHYAARRGDREAVGRQIAPGASPTRRDSDGRTARQHAEAHSRADQRNAIVSRLSGKGRAGIGGRDGVSMRNQGLLSPKRTD